MKDKYLGKQNAETLGKLAAEANRVDRVKGGKVGILHWSALYKLAAQQDNL